MKGGNLAERILSRLEHFGVRLGLETVRRVLRDLGDPHRALTTVLVAGTNGKGSVAALLSAIGTAGGYRTGLFTSPHLECVSERLKIEGQSIDLDRLGDLLAAVDAQAHSSVGRSATYFETLFMAACLWMVEEHSDLAVLEVGLGGRLDATNVAEPVLSVITEIGIEHRAQLGDSVELIAREKAGVLRAGRPVVAGSEDEIALRCLREHCERVGSLWIQASERVEIVSSVENRDWSQSLRLSSDRETYDAHLGMAGDHQARNLVTAVAAAEALRDCGWKELDRGAVEKGVKSCAWPGRLERVALPGHPEVILDAAHNPQATGALSDFLENRLPNYTLLFGVLDDKDVGEMLPVLSADAAEVVLTRPQSTRSKEPSTLLGLSRCAKTVAVRTPEDALDRALASGRPVVACGSIYLVGELRGLLRKRFGVPAPK